MPDNFHYLYQHGRHESETYDLTECDVVGSRLR